MADLPAADALAPESARVGKRALRQLRRDVRGQVLTRGDRGYDRARRVYNEVYSDARSAAALAALPGLELDAARVETVVTADDPVAAGIASAVDTAVALLAVEGVAGVNLSGMASARGVRPAAEIQAEVGRLLRHRVTSRRDRTTQPT